MSNCKSTFEFANGEVASCTLMPGHDDEHVGTVLGSMTRWPQGVTSEYEESVGRSPQMRDFINHIANDLGITRDFMEASDHKYDCTCGLCAEWWREMGKDPDTGRYGPFGESLPEPPQE